MASVAMNVITGAQNNNTTIFEQMIVVEPPPKPSLLQIRGDEDKNRVIIAPDLWEKTVHNAMERETGCDINNSGD